MKSGRYESLFCLFLSFLLLFTGEAPAYAEGISGIRARREQERLEKEEEKLRLEREAQFFAYKEGVMLSANGTEAGDSLQDASEFSKSETSLRQPETAPLLLEEIYGEPVEVGRNYKTYLTSEGTYKTVFTSYANTYIKDGQEKPIDNTLVSGNGVEGTSYTNKENDVDVTFYRTAEKEAVCSVSGNGMEAVWMLSEGNYDRAAVSENAIRYNEVFPGVDVQYTVQADGVKQDVILLAPQDKSSFTYRLEKEGIQARLENNCICLYKEQEENASAKSLSGNTITEGSLSGNSISGEPVMIISAPRMEDSLGSSSDEIILGMEEKEDCYEITLLADEQWLQSEERIYPVKIDPDVIVLKGEIDSVTVSSAGGTYWGNTESFTGYFDGMGKTRSYIITSYLYQLIGAGAKGVDVLSASLDVYQLNGSTGFDIGCYRLETPLQFSNVTWDNSVVINRHIAGEDAVKPAGEGWHSFDIRDAVSGWMNVIYESHGMVLISSDETKPGARFATENYPDAAYRPSVIIEWQLSGDVPFNYGLNDTTVNLRPMVLSTTDGKMQCYGVFADGLAKPYSLLRYELSDAGKSYNGLLGVGNEKIYPDSASFQQAFPAGTLRYKDVKSNWQTYYPFTEFEYHKPYTIRATAAYQDKTGSRKESDTFLIYRATGYDTLSKIADYYGIPLATLMFDNKAADTLMVENNTLFIRNPTRNQDTPYQTGTLSDDEKRRIDQMLLGRALHCEFGFEPVNMNTGNYFLAQEDFSYSDSLGTFSFQRYYNGKNAGRMGSFGRGFTSFLDESISARPDGSLVYNREDGSSLVFTPDGKGKYLAPEGYQLQLQREKYGSASAEFSAGEQSYALYRYQVTLEDHSKRTFDGKGNLIQIEEENGAVLAFQRDGDGNLTGIIREGTVMPVTTTPEGMIATVTMPNGGIFRYAYDSRQNLSTVTDPLGRTKRFVYDNSHRMTAWYDENGTRVVQNTYDSQNRVTRQVDENGGVITLAYDSGRTVATDARGNKTTYEYDSQGRTTAVRYPDGTTMEKEYRNGLLVKEKNRLGEETAFTYDDRGNITEKAVGDILTLYTYDAGDNLTSFTDACGNVTYGEYDSRGNLLKLTDAAGGVVTYSYDGKNRPVLETDGNGNTIAYSYRNNCLSEIRINGRITDRFTYNALGQVITYTDGEGNTTTYAYDLLGRNTAVKQPEGNTRYIAYGKTGLVETVTDAMGGVTAYTYDKANNITAVTDPQGNRYEYTYDAGGNRLSEKDPEGNLTSWEYDVMERPVKAVDAMGGIWSYAYDAMDNLTSITDPLGNIQRMTYDGIYGQLLHYEDEEGIVTDYSYDPCGRLLGVTTAGILTEAYEYDSAGRLVSTTLANGAKERQEYDVCGNCILKTDDAGRSYTFAYDDENRLTEETTPSGYTYRYAYDNAGNLTSITAPDGSKETYTYDGNGRLLTLTDGEGNTTTYAYDGNDNLLWEILPEGNEYHYVYDALGRLVASADGRNYMTSYAYDRNGSLTGITNALGETNTYEYDALGRNISETDSLGRTYNYAYDGMGNLLTITAPDGGITAYAYDKAGRVTEFADAMGNTTTYAYDSFGRLVKETDEEGGNISYAYDVVGNLIALTNEEGEKTTWEYDLYGNVISETDAEGRRTQYSYDKENNPITVIDAAGGKSSLSYDYAGNPVLVKDPLGAAWTYAYDRAGRLVRMMAPDGGVTAYTYDKNGNLTEEKDSLSRITAYTYDRTGNLTGEINPMGEKISYEYDPLNRPITMIHEDGTKDLYAYDGAGNLICTKEGEQRTAIYTYDEMNRLSSVEDALGNKTLYTYDRNGNLIKETAPDHTETAYTYDALNRLTEEKLPGEGTWHYAYDRTGRITEISGPEGTKIFYEYDGAGNLVFYTKGEEETRYQYDSLNRVTRITDALGGETAYKYDPVGNLTKAVYADGGVCAYEYDKMGRLTGATDQAGLYRAYEYDTEGQLLGEKTGDKAEAANMRSYTYSYDKGGRLAEFSTPLAEIYTYSYDNRDRLIQTVSPEGRVHAYEYDGLSNLTAAVDGEGNRTSYAYDAKGRLTEEDLAGEKYRYAYDACDRITKVWGENSEVSYTYNGTGDLIGVKDGNGGETTYTYDKENRLTGSTDPLGNERQYNYDENGNLSVLTDENGTVTAYAYDALNRMTAKDTGENLSTASYSYDAMGRLTVMDDVTGESLYTYDSAGRLLSAADGNGKTLTYEYDLYGNITGISYPDGKKAAYTYDACDRMTSVTDFDGKTTAYEYDKDGNLTTVIREEGESHILYDKEGRVTALANTENGSVISAYGYAYDGRGNITEEKSRLLKEGKMEETACTYTYDEKSQLIRAEQTVTGEETIITEYAYDGAGNRILMESRSGKETLRVEYTYDQGGRLIKTQDSRNGTVTYEYDKAGNLTARREEGAGLSGADDAGVTGITGSPGTTSGVTEYHYLYDNAGRLSAVTDKDTLLMAALYDGNDNRTFMMEYTPELQRQDSLGGNGAEEEISRNGRSRSGEAFSDSIKEDAGEKEGLSIGSGEEFRTGDERISAEEESSGAKAFWYGALCQMADIFLPAPTPFKAWLHEKMGLTDDISVLWREEVYEADLGTGSLSVQEAGNPFTLMESIFADTTGESLSSDAYRQVSYVNDINRVNVQAVMEYTVNGGMGESVTFYSFGMQRESYTMTLPGLSAGAGETALRVEGTYYYTGTGSVSNLTDAKGNGRSYAYALSGEAYSFAMYKGEDEIISVTAGTYSAYAYNGEYTHQSIGLQYLRARYLSLETGTFTSRDSYGGRVWDILSQNRYTYAENNPVTYGDPSGHVTALKGIGSTVGGKVTSGLSNLKTAFVPAVNKKSTNKPLSVGATNGAGITTRNVPLSVGYNPGAGILGSTNKQPSLFDRLRPNNALVWKPINSLMNNPNNPLSYAEAVALKEEAARCLGYDYVNVSFQETIKQDAIKVTNMGEVYYIPEGYMEILLSSVTNEYVTKDTITETYHSINGSWWSYGESNQDRWKKTVDIVAKRNGRYLIDVAPRILDPNYPDTGKAWTEDFLGEDYEKTHKEIYVTLVLVNTTTGKEEIKECVVNSVKAHSYNVYPDGHLNSSLPYVAKAFIQSGLMQTGISYPKSYNAGLSEAFSIEHRDASVIEFIGMAVDFNISDYNLEEIIVER